MTLRIEPGCIVCGLCEAVAPSLFRVDDDGAVVIRQPVDDSEAAVAIQDCPVNVIVIDPDPVVD